jgi:hypothetical protein
MNNYYLLPANKVVPAILYNGGNSSKGGADIDGLKVFFKNNGDRFEDWITVGDKCLFIKDETKSIVFREAVHVGATIGKIDDKYTVITKDVKVKLITNGSIVMWNQFDGSIKEYRIETFDINTGEAVFDEFRTNIYQHPNIVYKKNIRSEVGRHYPTIAEAESDKERGQKAEKIWKMLDATGGSALDKATLNEVNLILEIINR